MAITPPTSQPRRMARGPGERPCSRVREDADADRVADDRPTPDHNPSLERSIESASATPSIVEGRFSAFTSRRDDRRRRDRAAAFAAAAAAVLTATAPATAAPAAVTTAATAPR